MTFLKLFKIESKIEDPMIALQLFLQNYTSLCTRDEWEAFAEDIKFVEDATRISLPELEFRITELIQECSDFVLMATNGEHHIAWSTYYSENWNTTYGTWYKDYVISVLKGPNDTMDVPVTSILFQPVYYY
jgi:hypothetical protein